MQLTLDPSSVADYGSFISRKSQLGRGNGFDPIWMPDFLFDFQKSLVEWALRRGRGAIFADCGLGKTVQELVWAENVARKTGGRVLIATPLAVSLQTQKEADKFGIEVCRSQDGKFSSSKIVITNYERLEHFDCNDFAGVVCDESSILKHFGGATRKIITRFMSKVPYRLLATATAAPNDYVELGTSSEALSELSNSDMLKRFFRQLDDKGQKSETNAQEQAEAIIRSDPSYYMKLAYRVAQTIGQWRLKHHAVTPFWRWVASWARACRMPSDLGFPDDGFVLPELIQREHIIEAPPRPDMLFAMPAIGLSEERDERRRTLGERVGLVAKLADHEQSAVVWCHMNPEGDALEKEISGARQISSRTHEDERVEIYNDFAKGSLRVLVIKPKIGAWGLNWQHCNHVIKFASHSHEQNYQCIRRCWRFGQKRSVTVDTVATGGELRVIANLKRKAHRADEMFTALVREMNRAEQIERENIYVRNTEVPSWL